MLSPTKSPGASKANMDRSLPATPNSGARSESHVSTPSSAPSRSQTSGSRGNSQTQTPSSTPDVRVNSGHSTPQVTATSSPSKRNVTADLPLPPPVYTQPAAQQAQQTPSGNRSGSNSNSATPRSPLFASQTHAQPPKPPSASKSSPATAAPASGSSSQTAKQQQQLLDTLDTQFSAMTARVTKLDTLIDPTNPRSLLVARDELDSIVKHLTTMAHAALSDSSHPMATEIVGLLRVREVYSCCFHFHFCCWCSAFQDAASSH